MVLAYKGYYAYIEEGKYVYYDKGRRTEFSDREQFKWYVDNGIILSKVLNSQSSNRGDWIETYSGRKFHINDPRPEDICIEDIAHALSNLCRFGGHTKHFYSVAQHSVLVHNLTEKTGICNSYIRLAALLHDASEAYLIDVPKPIKPSLTNYVELEKKVQAAIYKYFGVPQERLLAYEKRIKMCDKVALYAEAKAFMQSRGESWATEDEYNILCDAWCPGPLYSMSPEEAKKEFLLTFENCRV